MCVVTKRPVDGGNGTLCPAVFLNIEEESTHDCTVVMRHVEKQAG